MKSTTLIGLLLIVLGVFSFIYKGINYTTQEKVFDIGSIEATATKNKTIPLSPLFGSIALAAGVTLMIVGSKYKNV